MLDNNTTTTLMQCRELRRRAAAAAAVGDFEAVLRYREEDLDVLLEAPDGPEVALLREITLEGIGASDARSDLLHELEHDLVEVVVPFAQIARFWARYRALEHEPEQRDALLRARGWR